MLDQWRECERPARLERRYTFSGYAALREFLDRAAELSEQMDLYPDLSFGRDYVNVTIHGYEEGLTAGRREFAERLEALYVRLSES